MCLLTFNLIWVYKIENLYIMHFEKGFGGLGVWVLGFGFWDMGFAYYKPSSSILYKLAKLLNNQ